MGRPCDCFCGGSSGDGGGGLPPGSQDPLTSSGNGPYKVYAGTIAIGGLPSGQEGGSHSWSNGSHKLKDSFIYGFRNQPTIHAFNDTFIYMADAEEEIVALWSPNNVNDRNNINDKTQGGKPPQGSGDYRIFDFKAARESAFTEEERSYGLGKFLGIGSRHIQLAGGHITMAYHQDSGVFLSIEKDNWDPYQDGATVDGKYYGYGLVFLAAVDQRSFFGSGGKIYSCGDNYLGRLGRGGGYSTGEIPEDWEPAPISDVADCPACSYKYSSWEYTPGGQFPEDPADIVRNSIPVIWLSPDAGALSMNHPDGDFSDDGEPNHFAVAFGDVNKVGYKHTNYDPEISSPPEYVPGPSPFKFESCIYDSWESTAFFGSKMFTSGGISQEGSQGGGKQSLEDGIRGPLGASYYGFGFELVHEQPPEAFPFIDKPTGLENNYAFSTNYHVCVKSSGRHCGELPAGWTPADIVLNKGPQLLLARNYERELNEPCGIHGKIHGCADFEYFEPGGGTDEEDFDFDNYDAHSNDMPLKTFSDLERFWKKEGHFMREKPIAYNTTALASYIDNRKNHSSFINFSHSQYQYSLFQYVTMGQIALTKGGADTKFGTRPYAWVADSLQWYGFGMGDGCEGNPEGSGSFCVAFANGRCDLPPVGLIRYSTDSDHDSVYYSGVGPYAGDGLTDKLQVDGSKLNVAHLLCAFLPSGLESCTIPVEESLIDKVVNVGTEASIYNYTLLQQTPRPIYCVYYSGDPIVNFTNWWNRS
tara:strand:+ start:195 stop:2462 length:2268 start_codon:yes stop_codon:yes gene_type:complete